MTDAAAGTSESVAAVIPNWNRGDLLKTLLDNLRSQTRAFNEVVVVDNGSTDDSVQVAQEAGACVLRLERNLGFAPAVNRGIAAAKTDWIAILNNDVTLAPDWLAVLLAAARKDIVWFATGKTLSAQDHCVIDGAFDAVSRGACAYRCGSGKPDGPAWNQPRRIRMAPMTAVLIRRELFEQIGELDERFESYLEDVDFGIRAALAGKWGVYEPAAIAYHLGNSTWGRWHKESIRLLARNQVLLAAKHFRGQPLWPILVGQLLWGLLAFRHGRLVSYLRGKFAGLGLARSLPPGPASEDGGTLFRESEREILEIQQQTGFDVYWRAYFWSLRR